MAQRIAQQLRRGRPPGATGPTCPVPELAVALAASVSHLGCKVLVRRVQDTKQYWSKCMGSTFVICTLPGSAKSLGRGLVIEPELRELFATSLATPRYSEICSSLPSVFVGQASQLSPLLQLLCYELSLVFDSLQRQLPPWRTFQATHGRWLSSSCFDLAVPARVGPGATEQVVKVLASMKDSASTSGGSSAKAKGRRAEGCAKVVLVSGFCVPERAAEENASEHCRTALDDTAAPNERCCDAAALLEPVS